MSGGAVLTSAPLAGREGVFVHPVAESAVLAGNATIGAEILEDLPDCDAVIVPFGGGGLICGIGSVMRRLRPAVRMIVAESEAAQPAAAALLARRPTRVPHRQSFVDGMGSTTVLAEMWPLCARWRITRHAPRSRKSRTRFACSPAAIA